MPHGLTSDETTWLSPKFDQKLSKYVKIHLSVYVHDLELIISVGTILDHDELQQISIIFRHELHGPTGPQSDTILLLGRVRYYRDKRHRYHTFIAYWLTTSLDSQHGHQYHLLGL